jgi:hypothetical protein
VVARLRPTANVAIDANCLKAVGDGRREEKPVKFAPGI